jgi:hypothetical protein
MHAELTNVAHATSAKVPTKSVLQQSSNSKQHANCDVVTSSQDTTAHQKPPKAHHPKHMHHDTKHGIPVPLKMAAIGFQMDARMPAPSDPNDSEDNDDYGR